MFLLSFLIVVFTSLSLSTSVNADQVSFEQWVQTTERDIWTLIKDERLIPVTLYPAMDTELGGRADVIIGEVKNQSGQIVIPFYSKVLCTYEPVRNVKRIPHTCSRILASDGQDFRISGTIYGEDMIQGTPADRIKANGALQVDNAKRLYLKITDVHAIGILGGPYLDVSNQPSPEQDQRQE